MAPSKHLTVPGLAFGLSLGLACLAPTHAQQLFDSPHKRSLPAYPVGSRTAALADVDGDGDFDAIVGRTESNLLFLNNGRGVFVDASTARMPQDDGDTWSLALLDVDGDGDLDLVAGNNNISGSGADRLYLNDGTGRFTDVSAAQFPQVDDATAQVIHGDVDGDGDPDLLLVGGPIRSAPNRLLLNNGAGSFTDASTQLPSDVQATGSAALFDADGDGDLDIYEGNGGFPSIADRLLLNDGSGTFTPSPTPIPGTANRTIEVLVDDFDADGDQDVFTVVDYFGARLMLNDGSGVFTVAPDSQVPTDRLQARNASIVDLDGDGDSDVLVAIDFDEGPALYTNDGAGTFTLTNPVGPSDQSLRWDYAPGDVDGDGDQDLYVARARGLSDGLFLNNGNGTFIDGTGDPQLAPFPIELPRVTLADFNGDGLPDLAAVRDRLTIRFGNGFGDFLETAPNAIPPGLAGDLGSVATGDYDNDGDVDLVVTRYADQNSLLLNDGNGQFVDASSQLPQIDDLSAIVVAADVDRDGDLDLVIGNTSNSSSGVPRTKDCLLLNDGTAHFRRAGLTDYPTANLPTRAIEFADVDQDGAPDVASVLNRTLHIYTNIGRGQFRDFSGVRSPALLSALTSAFAFGDIDADGDLDLWAGGQSGQELYRNDGSGNFTPINSGLPAPVGSPSSGRLFDQDGDGDLDLVYVESGAIQLFDNDGSGNFTALPDAIDGRETLNSALLIPADFDGDGDQDVLISGQSGATRIENNLTRQLSAPYLARLGDPYEVEFHSAAANSPRQVPVLLSVQAARIDLGSLGVLGLDPNTAVALGAIQVPASAVRSSLTFHFPTDPVLQGTEFFLQGFDPGQGSPRLTNRVRDVLTD